MASRLWSLFGSPGDATPPPADMRCIPCSGLDISVRDLTRKKLEQSLTTLVERKFPRAGARLALRNGLYEFQVPRTFDSTTKPIAFTVEDFAESYRSAARPEIPTDRIRGFTSQPVVCPMPPEEYFRSKTCPTSLEGFIVPNMPLTHAHVAVFDDITFIGITSAHITFDALGTATLLRAWTRLLGGEDVEAIPGMEWDATPFKIFERPSDLTHQRGWFDLGLLGQFLFIVLFILRLVRDPKEEGRLVRFPKGFLEDTKTEIMEDLKRQSSAEWVGSSDILLAWWFKTIYSLRKPGDTTPIHIHLPINLREKRIFPGGSTMGTPYIHNSVSAIAIPPISVTEWQAESLGELALRFRRAILAYNADLPAIAADVQFRCANPLLEHFPCPPRGEFSFQTNWRSANLGELDFSGARAEEPGEKGKTHVLLAVGYALSSKKNPMRGAGGMFMEDEDAVWMFQIKGTKEWEGIHRSGRIALV
ncbi:hypothetical protein B0H14DRAFT_2899976 [Mycena olivaceomarginata]|nr:hypothetical protein B0H14DRAFT_2899976 [Mycena olivaceomarginata]